MSCSSRGESLASLSKADRDRRCVKLASPKAHSAANKRSDYLIRLARRIGLAGDLERAVWDLLGDVWEKDLRPHNANSLWNECI